MLRTTKELAVPALHSSGCRGGWRPPNQELLESTESGIIDHVLDVGLVRVGPQVSPHMVGMPTSGIA